MTTRDNIEDEEKDKYLFSRPRDVELADDHYLFIKDLVEVVGGELDPIHEFFFKHGFRHGYKHACEDIEGLNVTKYLVDEDKLKWRLPKAIEVYTNEEVKAQRELFERVLNIYFKTDLPEGYEIKLTEYDEIVYPETDHAEEEYEKGRDANGEKRI
jgi:alpha-mannosidase